MVKKIVPSEPWKHDPNYDPKEGARAAVFIFSGFLTIAFGVSCFVSTKSASWLLGVSPDTCEFIGGGLCVIGVLVVLYGASLLPKSNYPGDPGGIIR